MAFAGILLVTIGAHAATIEGLQQDITIGEIPLELSFKVSNDSPTAKQLTISATMPTKYEVVASRSLRPNSTETVKIRIFPESGFEGSTYTGQIVIDLGGNRAEKNVQLTYERQDSCSVKADASISGDGKATITLQNQSYKRKTVELLAVKGVPNDWTFTGNKAFNFGPYEKRNYELTVKRQGMFEGEAEFVFKCGQEEFSEKTPVKFTGEGTISPFAVIGSIAKAADINFMIDAFLVIIAAILLIAFIARMVRILATPKSREA